MEQSKIPQEKLEKLYTRMLFPAFPIVIIVTVLYEVIMYAVGMRPSSTPEMWMMILKPLAVLAIYLLLVNISQAMDEVCSAVMSIVALFICAVPVIIISAPVFETVASISRGLLIYCAMTHGSLIQAEITKLKKQYDD